MIFVGNSAAEVKRNNKIEESQYLGNEIDDIFFGKTV